MQDGPVTVVGWYSNGRVEAQDWRETDMECASERRVCRSGCGEDWIEALRLATRALKVSSVSFGVRLAGAMWEDQEIRS